MKQLFKKFIFVLAIVMVACNPMGVDVQNVTPNLNASSASLIDPTVLNATTVVGQPQTLTFGTGNQTYTITSNVSWYGSTTTWTYTIVAADDAKDISHFSFLGIDGCFLSNWSNQSATGLLLTQEGNTGCVSDLTTQVYKFTPSGIEERGKTFTFTFDKALAVDESAAQLYIKAGAVQGGGGCGYVTIPGPSCTELQIGGKVEKKVCVENTTTVQPYEGVTVTAEQGSQVLTAATAADGTYSFPNVGGEWVVSVVDGGEKLVTAGPDNGSADFLVDLRTNGSCAAIVGTVSVIECFQQSSRTIGYVGAIVNCEHASCTSTTGGAFRFNNASVQTHTITVDGVSKQVSVTAEDGVVDAGEFVVDKTDGGVCGDTEVVCSLSQGYWFAKPNAVWPGSVVLGGKTYTQSEGKAIWNTSNSKGLLNAKAAFTQASAIKLSNVSPNASVWADVQIIENYFNTIAKLNPASLPPNAKTGLNAQAGAAAGRLGTWIQNNHCNE